jgi:hypothetical protein
VGSLGISLAGAAVSGWFAAVKTLFIGSYNKNMICVDAALWETQAKNRKLVPNWKKSSLFSFIFREGVDSPSVNT